jgi:leucyl/phenylalanyl-tRNA---protein transferase
MTLPLRTGNFGRLFSEGVEPEPPPPPAALRLRREAALHENLSVRARRLMRVVAGLMRPKRAASLAATFDLFLRDRLVGSPNLPNPSDALQSADGLAGLASDLAPAAMMEAYAKGLSPDAALGPIAWHSRDLRSVAAPADIMAAHAALTEGADPAWSVTFDRDIEAVLARGGRPAGHSAIMPARLLGAFAGLFDTGFAHSFEVRDAAGATIGGGFGVAVGGIFALEGAFELTDGAARFGLAHLAARLDESHFTFIECAPGAAWLGPELFQSLPREDYLAQLALHMGDEKVGRWRNRDPAKPAPTPAEDGRLAA